jgi:predicted amidohydrolase
MAGFSIAAAQVATVPGDLERNVRTHAAAIVAAARLGVAVLIFPELSLVGYEPEMAARLAVAPDDLRLAELLALARRHRMHVAVGAPLLNDSAKPHLGAILFGPDGSTRSYAKNHLGGTEPDFFSPGRESVVFESHGETIGLSICADSSQPSHPARCAALGSTVYAAGMFLTAEWFATDAPRLAAFAPRHRMLVLMANHAASSGPFVSVGRSAAWSPDGRLLAQCRGTEDALVVATRGAGGWSATASEL